MNHRLLVVLLVGLLATSVFAGHKQKSSRVDVDDDGSDEFSEFDDEFESPKQTGSSKPASSTQAPPSQQQKQQQQQQKPVVDDDDFDSVVVEDDEPAVVRKKPADTSKHQQQQKTPDVDKKSKSGGDFNADEFDMEEFENFVDEDEFEASASSTPSGFEAGGSKSESSKESGGKSTGNKQQDASGKGMPNLKIADVPLHLMSSGNWTNYVWEICMLVVIAIYMVNFFYGKSKNYSLVNHWFQTHRAVLEKNFAVVGDDGLTVDVPKSEQNETGSLIKDSESNYALWCTGRHGCEGMLVQLKLIKRQDLINGKSLKVDLLKAENELRIPIMLIYVNR